MKRKKSKTGGEMKLRRYEMIKERVSVSKRKAEKKCRQ